MTPPPEGSKPPRRATYASASSAPLTAEELRDGPQRSRSNTRTPGVTPVAPSNFFSPSSSSSSSTSPHFPPKPKTRRPTTSDRSTLDPEVEEIENSDGDTVVVQSSRSSRTRPHPPPPPAGNPWTNSARSSTSPALEPKKKGQVAPWNVPDLSLSNPPLPLPPSSSPSFRNLALHPVAAHAPPSDPPPVPATTFPPPRTASARPECDGDGKWTTARLLAKEGDGGSKAGIWKYEAFDFEVEDTPKDAKYKPMGDWVKSPRVVRPGEQGPETDNNDDDEEEEVADQSDMAKQGKLKKPKRGFQTIQRSELDKIRPHSNLFFCCDTLSWGLFAKVRPPSRTSTASGTTGVPLWQFGSMEGYRDDLEAHESIHHALFDELKLPHPLRPFDPESLRTAPEYAFPGHHHPSLRALKLSLATSTRNDRVIFSTQEFFPSALGQELWNNLLFVRGQNPQPDQTSAQAGAASINFLWRALDDVLFKGETRALPVDGKTFRKSMPWDDVSCDIFLSVLGYTLISDGSAIQAPNIDIRSLDGSVNRHRLLRTWLETGIWLQNYFNRTNDISIKRETRIKLFPAKSRMVEIVGGDDLTKVDQSQAWTRVNSAQRSTSALPKQPDFDPLAAQYSLLGCTPDLSDESIIRVYDAQTKEWPVKTPDFLDVLIKISNVRSSESLSTKVATERSKGIYSRSEIDQAYSELRLPSSLQPFDLISEDELSRAFDKRMEDVTHPERRKVLKEAFNTIAEHRQSDVLRVLLLSLNDSEGGGDGNGMQGVELEQMDLDKAYKALEIGREVDDETIAMVYEVRKSDATDDAEKTKMQTAIGVIAQGRSSARLAALAEEDAGLTHSHGEWQLAPVFDRNVPIGLTNIANTCYLNSLLQYFFTVREVRDAVLSFANNELDHGNAQIRVGGRLVAQKEIERSQRFVVLLQALFRQLIHSTLPAVTPETELAYLALVPGKEEHEAEAAKNKKAREEADDDDDDLIIVEPSEKTKEKEREGLEGSKSPSVLGKRRTDEKEEDVPMLLDASISPGIASIPPDDDSCDPASGPDADMAEASPLPSLSRTSSSTMFSPDERTPKRGRSVDELSSVETSAARTSPLSSTPVEPIASSSALNPPALPPRPRAPTRKQTKEEELGVEVSNYMAFGRQNDVTECMDNVMFQIEAALKANVMGESEEGVGNLLKRTFYGTNRQRLSFDDPSTTSDPVRTRDDPFSSLLVDVPPTSFDRDLYDGLDAVFDDAPVEIEGKSARRSISLVELPPVLQIQLQRVQYDREKGRIFKSNAHLQFFDELNLGRYLEVEASDVKGLDKKRRTHELRSALQRTRKRLARLEQNTNQSQQLKDALDHFATIPEELGDLLTPALSEDTAIEAQDLDNEIVALRRRVRETRREMIDIWKEGQHHGYELRSVFIHRGTASSGHYFVYQRDSREPDRWLKYNDAVITNVDREEIFRETTTDTNAYFLVYCRKDRLDAIETIKREVV